MIFFTFILVGFVGIVGRLGRVHHSFLILWCHHSNNETRYNTQEVLFENHWINFLVFLLKIILVKSNAISSRPQIIDYSLSNLFSLFLGCEGVVFADDAFKFLLSLIVDLIRRVNALFIQLLDGLPLNISLATRSLRTSCSHFIIT